MQDGGDVPNNHILAPICRHLSFMQEQSITHMYTCLQLSNQSIHHHHRHSASYKTYIQYMLPPPHSASYNITATTCASRVSAPVGDRKRPLVHSGPRAAHAPFTPAACARKIICSMAKERPSAQVTAGQNPAPPPFAMGRLTITCNSD